MPAFGVQRQASDVQAGEIEAVAQKFGRVVGSHARSRVSGRLAADLAVDDVLSGIVLGDRERCYS